MSIDEIIGLVNAAQEYADQNDEDAWCQRIRYGKCTTRRCVVEGHGGTLPDGFIDLDASTCARWRLQEHLTAVRARLEEQSND